MNPNLRAWPEGLRHRLTSFLIFSAAASIAPVTMAQSQPIPPVAKPTAPALACLFTSPAPTSAMLTYGGRIPPVKTRIDQIMPECIRFDYAGNVAWTTANEAGGVSCVGNTVQIDWSTANRGAFSNMRGKTPPAACGPQMPVPSGPPPAATGPTVKVYYDKTVDMATVPLLSATADCYQVNLEGGSAWFPSSALGYRTEFYGNPVGLDYKARRSMPCGVEPTPAKPPAPPPACLVVRPAPTSALLTYGGRIPPIKTRIDQIMPKCIRFDYAGNPIWTTANEAGGISCAGDTVQIDFSKAIRVFNGPGGTMPPATCN